MSETLYTFDELGVCMKRIRLGPAGRVDEVEVLGDREGWCITPIHRQRLDHYVGCHYNPGEDDDPEGWDSEGWESEYSGPAQKAAMEWLISTFGPGHFSVDVGEKGHVYIYLGSLPKRS